MHIQNFQVKGVSNGTFLVKLSFGSLNMSEMILHTGKRQYVNKQIKQLISL